MEFHFFKKTREHFTKIMAHIFLKTNGLNVWDLNKRKYEDFFSVGQNILGYNNKHVDRVVKKICNSGTMSSLNCSEEVFSRKVNRNASLVWYGKICKNWCEANSIAIRIARAATGNDKVAICGYHGWHDWYLSANLKNKDNLNVHLLKGLLIDGVPKNLKGTIFPFRYNNFEELENIVKK